MTIWFLVAVSLTLQHPSSAATTAAAAATTASSAPAPARQQNHLQRREATAVVSNDGNLSASSPPSCTLTCLNGGYCSLISEDPNVLAKQAQSGNLIQTCNCPEGYGGIGCEIALTQCRAVLQSAGVVSQQQTLDVCGQLAERVSLFAGAMCRFPVTTYCGGSIDYASLSSSTSDPLSFCTNGGKCKSSLLAAQLAPGNMTATWALQYAGCSCPAQFSGPHCEFLNYQPVLASLERMVAAQHKAKQSKTVGVTLTMLLLLGISVGSYLYLTRGRRFRSKQLQQEGGACLSRSGFADDNDDDEENHHGILDGYLLSKGSRSNAPFGPLAPYVESLRYSEMRYQFRKKQRKQPPLSDESKSAIHTTTPSTRLCDDDNIHSHEAPRPADSAMTKFALPTTSVVDVGNIVLCKEEYSSEQPKTLCLQNPSMNAPTSSTRSNTSASSASSTRPKPRQPPTRSRQQQPLLGRPVDDGDTNDTPIGNRPLRRKVMVKKKRHPPEGTAGEDGTARSPQPRRPRPPPPVRKRRPKTPVAAATVETQDPDLLAFTEMVTTTTTAEVAAASESNNMIGTGSHEESSGEQYFTFEESFSNATSSLEEHLHERSEDQDEEDDDCTVVTSNMSGEEAEIV